MMLVALLLSWSIVHAASGGVIDPRADICRSLASCSECISHDYCTWCVNKNHCSKQACGNDNIIFPEFSTALMAGPNFCPRVDSTEELTIKSGQKESIQVKITQIHLHMAFTPWKCKIDVGDKEVLVNAVVIADTVYCDPVTLSSEVTGDTPVDGRVKILWDFNKPLDGYMPIKLDF